MVTEVLYRQAPGWALGSEGLDRESQVIPAAWPDLGLLDAHLCSLGAAYPASGTQSTAPALRSLQDKVLSGDTEALQVPAGSASHVPRGDDLAALAAAHILRN